LLRVHRMGHRNQVTRITAAAIVLIAALSFRARASDSVELAGDILWIVMPATAAGLATGYRDGQGALQFGEAAALTLAVTCGLKYTIDAERPDGGDESFPSGHASLSFCSAEFIRKRYGLAYGLPSYAVASFVAYSRVEANRHYPRDVAAGAAIGIVSSYVFTKPYRGWSVEPQVDAGYYGLRLAKCW
jgi:membrane-associated phospholipid phosphatase